jgi:iron-sulfur cluster repair protein YtfE (RIC family)
MSGAMPLPQKRADLLKTNPLIEITLLHRAMRLELEAMCAAARALAASAADEAPALANLRRRFRAFDAVFASHSAAEDDVVFPALAACAGRDVASHAAAEHIDEVALVDGAAAALDRAAARGRCDAGTVAALQDLKEKLADHMDHEEAEIFPLLASVPELELKRMVGLVLGARPADVLELTIRLQVQHLEPALARHVLATMCDVARGTNFRRWLDRALGAAAAGPPAPAPPAAAAATAPPPPPRRRCPRHGHAARIAAPCCGALVCCRRCHDARPGECGQAMDARRVTDMVCAECGVRGPVGRRCASCAVPQASYYCGHCKHFDDSGAHTFHCPFCDVCRRGHGLGVDFHHCMRCNMCVDITQIATHVCTGAGQACGACGGDLAATPDRVVVLGCGHPAHARCAAAAPPDRCLVCAPRTA